MSEFVKCTAVVTTFSKPIESPIDGFERALVFYDRPLSPPGNGWAFVCPLCWRLREQGHADDCARKAQS